MELQGELTGEDRTIYEKFLVPVSEKLQNELIHLPKSAAREALIQVYNDLSAITASIMVLCQQPKTSSQATASLMRTLIECCLTAFALSRSPEKQSELYINFRAVLDYRFACCHEAHLGCPLVKDNPEKRARITARKDRARKVLYTVGLDYLQGESTPKRLQEVLSTDNHKKFRDKWYVDSPRTVLKAEGMEWLYDVLYTRLCSAVHSDSAASMVFKDLEKGTVFTFAREFYAAALYRLVEAFDINVSALQKGILRKSYSNLQSAN